MLPYKNIILYYLCKVLKKYICNKLSRFNIIYYLLIGTYISNLFQTLNTLSKIIFKYQATILSFNSK